MAKLSTSALRNAAQSARERNEENKQIESLEPKKEEIEEKGTSASEGGAFVLQLKNEETKTVHVNLLITPSLNNKIDQIQKQGGFRSKNAAVIAVLEAYCETAGIK